MPLSKTDIENLQSFLTPSTKLFNIIEIISRFPHNNQIHQTFREICLHYQQPQLSFTSIMEYLFGSLNQQTQANHHLHSQPNLTQELRIQKKNGKQVCKIILLGPEARNQRIKQLLIVEDEEMNAVNIYASTHTSVRQYNTQQQQFNQEFIKLPANQTISKISIFGNIITYLNKNNQLYMQIIPKKLNQNQQANLKSAKNSNTLHQVNQSTSMTTTQTISTNIINKYKPKTEISKTIITKLPEKQQVIHLEALNEAQWIICTPKSITVISTPILLPVPTRSFVLQQSLNTQMSQFCKLKYPFMAMITNNFSILIVDIQSMKINNRIYNDANFVAFTFNQSSTSLIASDFGGFLMSLTFNQNYGDLEEEGISFKQQKQKIVYKPLNEQFLQTHFLKISRSTQSPTKKQISIDPPLTKQKKTTFSKVIQNQSRNVLSLLCTKNNSLFTYQSRTQNMIKIWNIQELRVYQKIQLTIQITEMQICLSGLFLISSQKGYLCHYPLQSPTTSSLSSPHNISNISINSNILFIQTTNLTQTNVYKMILSNKPKIMKYYYQNAKNIEKWVKFAMYKKQAFIMDISKSDDRLKIIGVFGEEKDCIKGLQQYEHMVEYKAKQGIILWGNQKLFIKCNNISQPILQKTTLKGQQIFSNFNQQSPACSTPSYTSTIVFPTLIQKVKVFETFISIYLEQTSHQLSIYVIDENTISLFIVFTDITPNLDIIQTNRHCCLALHRANRVMSGANNRNQKEKTNSWKGRYFLYGIELGKTIWQLQQKVGWNIQTCQIVEIHKNKVLICCIWSRQRLAHQQETSIQLCVQIHQIKFHKQQRFFVSISKNVSKHYKQVDSLEQIKQRSIYRKITQKQLLNNPKEMSQNHIKCYQIILPSKQTQCISHVQYKNIDIKILHSQNHTLIIALLLASKTAIYQLTDNNNAKLFAVLDFGQNKSQQSSEAEEGKIKHPQKNQVDKLYTDERIKFWDQGYKKDEQQLWEETKNHALRSIKMKRQQTDFIYSRTNSLRSTNRKWNPETLQPFILSSPNKTKSTQQLPKTDPKRINELIFKNNIQSQIHRKTGQVLVALPLQRSKSKKQYNVNHNTIEELIDNVKQTKKQLSNSSHHYYNETKNLRIKTQKSIKSQFSHYKDSRFETEAMEQLERSKFMEQKMFPKLETSRKEQNGKQKERKDRIYEMLKKQTMSLKQSRNIRSISQKLE